MFWKPSRLTCHIYENKEPLDLSLCSWIELLALMNSIDEMWNKPKNGDQWTLVPQQPNVWFTVDVEEPIYCLRPRNPSIKVSCFTLHPRSWSGKKQLPISKVQHGRPINIPLPIYPANTMAYSWSGKMEVIFRTE